MDDQVVNNGFKTQQKEVEMVDVAASLPHKENEDEQLLDIKNEQKNQGNASYTVFWFVDDRVREGLQDSRQNLFEQLANAKVSKANRRVHGGLQTTVKMSEQF